jgi:diguanylate cyclase (GGDEF)-like protein
MLFLKLENQLFLIIILMFSSWFIINSIVTKPQPEKLRAFGFSFAIPLIFGITAFLESPYNAGNAFHLLLLGHIFCVLLCTFILFLPDHAELIKILYVVPFILSAIVLIFRKPFLDRTFYDILGYINILLILINLAMVLYTLIKKKKESPIAHAGIIMISVALLGIWILYGPFYLENILLIGLGYITLSVYLYRTTSKTVYTEYINNAEALKRLNKSIQSEVIRRVEQIERSNKKLVELSKTDSMTGFYVKTAVIASLENFIQRFPQLTMTVLMFDIDNFKKINDSMGHQIGDRCIKNLASLALRSFRKDDIIGRFGGDEFIVLLPSTPAVKAYVVADRFRQLVEDKSSPKITISIGLANYPNDGTTPSFLIEAADQALYCSKQKGRNQVTLYSSISNE